MVLEWIFKHKVEPVGKAYGIILNQVVVYLKTYARRCAKNIAVSHHTATHGGRCICRQH